MTASRHFLAAWHTSHFSRWSKPLCAYPPIRSRDSLSPIFIHCHGFDQGHSSLHRQRHPNTCSQLPILACILPLHHASWNWPCCAWYVAFTPIARSLYAFCIECDYISMATTTLTFKSGCNLRNPFFSDRTSWIQLLQCSYPSIETHYQCHAWTSVINMHNRWRW